jgi:hypothetical protein
MTEKNESQKPPPPKKEGEPILEYSIRISKDKRTPEQVKGDSEKVKSNIPPIKPTPDQN